MSLIEGRYLAPMRSSRLIKAVLGNHNLPEHSVLWESGEEGRSAARVRCARRPLPVPLVCLALGHAQTRKGLGIAQRNRDRHLIRLRIERREENGYSIPAIHRVGPA